MLFDWGSGGLGGLVSALVFRSSCFIGCHGYGWKRLGGVLKLWRITCAN